MFSMVARPILHFHQQCMSTPFSPPPCQHLLLLLLFFFFFGDKNFHRIEVASHCDIYISLIVNDVGIFFMSVLIICIFFGIMFIQVLCLFLIMMFVFDVELCEFFIYFGA